MNDRKMWFWLNNIEGIGNIKIRRLLEVYTNPEEIFSSNEDELVKIPGITQKDAANICNREQSKYIFDKFEKYIDRGMKFVFPWEHHYPKRLFELYDRPNILYYKGKLPEEEPLTVAIVGSRKCSEYGRSIARELGRRLSIAGANVISGLALGIDSEAHKGAVMAGGKTYAVLAGSVDKCYPPSNYNLYMDVINSGGIISEFPPGTPTVPGMFPLRNRIVSGLSDVVIVVEAGEKSGSLITVSHALEQNRQVYAVPGRIGDRLSEGCNRLILEGAGIVTSMESLFLELGLDVPQDEKIKKDNLRLAREEKMLYSLLLDFTPCSLDTLLERTKASPAIVLNGLLGLELKGYIKEISKNFYVRIR